jgi:hypothetical protein
MKGARNDYENAKPWLKKIIKCLCRRNQLLFIQNPAVQPVLLQHFEPWYPLLWTDGSIGAISMGDLNTGELKAFYSGNTDKVSYIEREKYPNWIEQFALAPSKQPQEMLFYISILTQAFISDPRYKSAVKKLNAYGAVTWGNFLFTRVLTKIVDGCIPSSVDVSDMYAEK